MNLTREDKPMEPVIGTILRAGVITAAVIVILGGTFLLLREAGNHPNFSRFAGEPASLRSVAGIVRSAISFDSRGIVQLGILALIAVPILRVAVSLAGFALRKDWLYCAVTAAVLGMLVLSLAVGR